LKICKFRDGKRSFFRSKTMNRRNDAGFSLAALMFIATAVSIVLSAAYPAYKMQVKRQTEEELIFRGEEYARAIQKFYRKFGVYPPSIDALVQTNGLRFLRRVYKDPITGKDFRLISISPDGSLIGSSLPTQRINNTPLFGAPVQTFGGQTPAPGQSPTSLQSTPGAAAGSTSTPTTQANPTNPANPPNAGQRPAAASVPGFSLGPATQAPTSPQSTPQQRAQTPLPGFQQPSGGTVGSAGVVGVGSESTESSIKVYNQRQKYNEWEFIAIMTPTAPQAPGGPQRPGTGTPTPPGVGPAPGNPAPLGGNPANPFQTPSQSPTPFKRP
jgi:type II secretory pathway pseudopilin PulG